MGISIDKQVKQQLIFFTMLLMLVALFSSRALLSIGLILFLAATSLHKNFLQQFIVFAKNPFLIGMSLLFFIPFISWFWSDDKQMWARFARIKLPLFLFPLAFAGNWQLSSKQWKWIAYTFLILLFAGCCWSLWHYAIAADAVHKSYLKAKIFDTPLDNDHVRFSLIVCIGVICSVLLLKRTVLKTEKLILGFLAIFFAVYLHILSARTGLISLYIFLLAGLFYLLFIYRKPGMALLLVVAVIAMPVTAWLLFPTFQNRISYVLYDFAFIKESKYLPGANDGNRVLSLKAGWNVLQENPLGVGADVVAKTNEWYEKNIPQMLGTDKIFPSSEVLMYAGFAGWIGLMLFVTVMLLPLFENIQKEKLFWIVLNLVMAFSFLFDIGLEAQFGVFIYAFIILWWWKWLNSTEPVAK